MAGKRVVEGAHLMAGYVFISYAREDKAYVKGLEAEFHARGITCWWDKQLQPGEYFQTVIRKVIGSCATLVVVASQNVEKSAWVGREVALATQRNKTVLPLRVDESIPLVIAPIGYEDVRTYRTPPEDFFARVQRFCTEINEPVPPVGREQAPLPPPGTTPMTWLPYDLNGSPHTFRVEDGIVRSWTLEGQPRPRAWGHLGTGVSRIVATQDGLHLVLQTEAGLTMAEVDSTGSLLEQGRYPVVGGARLVAARRPPPGTSDVALQVLLSDSSSARIVAFDHDWSEVRGETRGLAHSVYAGAGTGDGFLVIDLDSVLVRLAADGERLTTLGADWCDVDVVANESGVAAAGLRRAGEAIMLRTTSSLADLDGAATEPDGDVRAVRLVRQLGRSFGAPDAWAVTSAGRPLTPFRGLPA